MFKKLALIIVVQLGLLLAPLAFLPAPALAVDVLSPVCDNSHKTSSPTVCGDNNTTGTNPILGPSGILPTVVSWMSIAVGIISVVMIMIGGFRFITSNGDAKSAEAGRNTVIYAVIGLVVAALAQILVHFVLTNVRG